MHVSADGRPPRTLPRRALAAAALLAAGAAACGGGGMEPDTSRTCTVDQGIIFDGGVPRDGIPALSNPSTSPPGGEGLSFLTDDTRVFGFQRGGRTVAVPQNILWWHEIANFEIGGERFAVTLCPLTGSSLAFRRGAIGGDEFVVSGLLMFNNLIMSPRNAESASLWGQMQRAAVCGSAAGTELQQLPVQDMRWSKWKELHPNTEVVNARTEFDRDYASYPYGSYDERGNTSTLGFPIGPLDPRRQPKERLLGFPEGDEGGLALPFLELEDKAVQQGGKAAVRVEVGGEQTVAFWDNSAWGAVAFRPRAGGRDLTFTVRDGQIVDEQTGSTWRLDGRAASGPLQGEQLPQAREPYVAFWFAWAKFQPETEIWTFDETK